MHIHIHIRVSQPDPPGAYPAASHGASTARQSRVAACRSGTCEWEVRVVLRIPIVQYGMVYYMVCYSMVSYIVTYSGMVYGIVYFGMRHYEHKDRNSVASD